MQAELSHKSPRRAVVLSVAHSQSGMHNAAKAVVADGRRSDAPNEYAAICLRSSGSADEEEGEPMYLLEVRSMHALPEGMEPLSCSMHRSASCIAWRRCSELAASATVCVATGGLFRVRRRHQHFPDFCLNAQATAELPEGVESSFSVPQSMLWHWAVAPTLNPRKLQGKQVLDIAVNHTWQSVEFDKHRIVFALGDA